MILCGQWVSKNYCNIRVLTHQRLDERLPTRKPQVQESFSWLVYHRKGNLYGSPSFLYRKELRIWGTERGHYVPQKSASEGQVNYSWFGHSNCIRPPGQQLSHKCNYGRCSRRFMKVVSPLGSNFRRKSSGFYGQAFGDPPCHLSKRTRLSRQSSFQQFCNLMP